MPKFSLEDLEDYYTYYVMILQIPEETFWRADVTFLARVAENKAAYDNWKNYVLKKEADRRHG